MIERYIKDPDELSMVLSVMLKAMLAEKLGQDRMEKCRNSFSYVMPMNCLETGEKMTYMVSYDDQNRFMMEQVENDIYPEHSIVFFNDDKESAILNAAINGDGFLFMDEETEKGPEDIVDPNDHFSDPELPC